MDTRRMPGSIEAAQWPSDEAVAAEVEIIELRHIERPIRGLAGRLVFVLAIAVLGGILAITGIPSRSTWALEAPVPNIFSTNATP